MHEATQNPEEARKDSPQKPSEGEWPGQHFDFGLPASGTVKEQIYVLLCHQICSNLLQQSQETNTGYKEKVGLLDPQTPIFLPSSHHCCRSLCVILPEIFLQSPSIIGRDSQDHFTDEEPEAQRGRILAKDPQASQWQRWTGTRDSCLLVLFSFDVKELSRNRFWH